MRIGIGYTIAVTGTAGLTRHARELVAALLETDHVNEYILTITSHTKGDVASAIRQRVTIRRLPFSEWGAKMIWHRESRN